MGILAEEVRQWNTPIIGAYLLWEFTRGYVDNHPENDAPVGLLHFLAIALLTSHSLSKPVNGNRPNLQSYVLGFENNKSSDLLLQIQDRTKSMREYTMSAIDIAVASGLLAWDTKTGKLIPSENTKKPGRGKALKPIFRAIGNKSRILGKWFSEHDVPVIASYLRVVL